MKNVKIVKEAGIVVHTTNYSNSSQIIEILTPNELISMMAKGSRNVKSRLKPYSHPLCFSDFYFYKKKEGLSQLIDGDEIIRFKSLENDPKKYNAGIYLAKFSRSVFKESEDNCVFNLLVTALKKIDENFDINVVINILEVKYLELLGVGIPLNELSEMGYPNMKNETKKVLFSYMKTNLKTLKSVKISKRTQDEINRFLESYYENYTGVILLNRNFLLKLINISENLL